ncbi:MAG TPA: DUF4912 domain-containing protein, partial [Candidatus Eisenbacteria bacterium]|nr:DUF4912 domain-containing protein [Candidatus Eisenbacteria bacterium]
YVSRKPTEPCVAARLLLLARDPHSVYAHWEITQKGEFGTSAANPEDWVLRLHHETPGGPLVAQVPITSKSSHAFIHVDAGLRYVGEIGRIDKSGGWFPMATSASVVTPNDTVSDDKSAYFAEIQPALPRSSFALKESSAQLPIGKNALKAEPAEPVASRVTPPRVSWLPSLTSGAADPSKNVGMPEMFSSEQADWNASLLPDYAEPLATTNRAVVGTVRFENLEIESVSSSLILPIQPFPR